MLTVLRATRTIRSYLHHHSSNMFATSTCQHDLPSTITPRGRETLADAKYRAGTDRNSLRLSRPRTFPRRVDTAELLHVKRAQRRHLQFSGSVRSTAISHRSPVSRQWRLFAKVYDWCVPTWSTRVLEKVLLLPRTLRNRGTPYGWRVVVTPDVVDCFSSIWYTTMHDCLMFSFRAKHGTILMIYEYYYSYIYIVS